MTATLTATLATTLAATITVALTAIATPYGAHADASSANSASIEGSANASYLSRPPSEEVVYFLLPDRFANGRTDNDTGGIAGDHLTHGFDPTHKAFYHGGDLAGLTQKLDYIEGLGATAIWLGPIYKNKAVQGAPGYESAGYHGYWITDFTTVDPHFGTEAELKAFVDAAHKRGMKVYLDIITNHTADVIAYRECHDPMYKGDDKVEGDCTYRSKAAYPYRTRGNTQAKLINKGFMGDQQPFQTAENFTHLVDPSFAYTPFLPKGQENAKAPAWLNDPIYYHNRGNTYWYGESITYGDFSGLDDLMTEHPQVVSGMIDIYKSWISRFHLDGFRIDTAKHVNPEFWHAFNTALKDHAAALGIPNFYIFGEAYHTEPAPLARHTRVDGFPYVLDFGFQSALTQVIAGGAPTTTLERLFAADALYEGGEETTRNLPIFTGNHDMGRFAMMIRRDNPDLTGEAVQQRLLAAHAAMFYLRGAPVIYYGDEQGFTGDGNDQAAREDMFKSRVDSYNDNLLLGTTATTADDNFDTNHPVYKALARMAAITAAHPALRSGAQVPVLSDHLDSGLFVVSRRASNASGESGASGTASSAGTANVGEHGGEYIVAFNFSDQPQSTFIATDPRSRQWASVDGKCPVHSAAPASLSLDIPAWGVVVCKSNNWKL